MTDPFDDADRGAELYTVEICTPHVPAAYVDGTRVPQPKQYSMRVSIPSIEYVTERIQDEINRARYRNRRPMLILIGARWWVAIGIGLQGPREERWAGVYAEDLEQGMTYCGMGLLVMGAVERGVRLVCRPSDELQVWEESERARR